MKFELKFERFYPHPVRAVWDGLTRDEALAEWLMETSGFRAEVGHRFEMSCDGRGGGRDVFRCRVLELEKPFRMLWSWVLAGKEHAGPMEVEFLLEAADGGTAVTVIHRGDQDESFVEDFRGGWPGKLDDLAAAVQRRFP